MSTPTPDAPELDVVDHRQAAIDALTAIVRTTYETDHGVHLVDFAGTLAHIVTAVAANIGSVDQLLAGRSGSWEADLVYRLVTGTVGEDDKNLTPYRTEPIRVYVDIDADPSAPGTDWRESWDRVVQDANDAYAREYDRALEAHAGDSRIVSEEDRARVQGTLMYEEKYLEVEHVWDALRAEDEWLRSVDLALAATHDVELKVSAAYERFEVAYRDRLVENIRDAAAARGYTAGVEIVDEYDPASPDRWLDLDLEEEAFALGGFPVPPQDLQQVTCEHGSLVDEADGTVRCSSCHAIVPTAWTVTTTQEEDDRG